MRQIVFAALVAATTSIAQAAEGEIKGEQVAYPASFFAPFAPQTALDMVERLPGFTIESGAEVRGFGGAAGNVLIDGRRPSSKSGNLADALSRVPASQVAEIVLIRGADTGEAQGQSLVANVIRSGDTDAGTWELTVERAGDGKVYPQGAATYSTALGPWSADFKANGYFEHIPQRSTRMLTDGTGGLIATRRDHRPYEYMEATASMEARRALGGGELRLTANAGAWEFDLDLDSRIFDGRAPGGPADAAQIYVLDESGWDGEFGADYSKSLNDNWTWTSLALVSGHVFIQRQSDEVQRPVGSVVDPLLIRLVERPLEALARTSFARAGAVVRPEFSIEAAYNRLDTKLFIIDGGAEERAAALIEELRGEARASLGWTIDPSWTLDTALAAELSQIAVSGASEEKQTLFFLKPSVTLAWTVSDRLQFRLTADHSVGQLDFSDFAASADSEADRETSGNPALEPDRTTRLSLSADWRFGDGGALTAELFHDWRQDALEFLLTPDGGEAIGNAGNASLWGLKGSLTVPLNDVLKGLTFKADFEVLETGIDDPITGERRRLSDDDREDSYYVAELRRDDAATGFAYGVSYEHGFHWTAWYTDQTDRLDTRGQWNAFVETTRIEGLKIRLESRSLTGERYRRSRAFYSPDRSGALDASEYREAKRGAFVKLTVSGSF
jgi:hypothetical protein